MTQKSAVVKDVSIGAVGLGFDSRASQPDTVSLAACHHCDVSSERYCLRTKPQK